MKITKISIQKNNKERYNVFGSLNGQQEQFVFGVHESVLIKHRLQKGTTLTDGQMKEIQEEDQLAFAKSYALSYVSRKMRTETEVENVLVDQEVPMQMIGEAIAYMKERGYINDEEYARSYVNYTMSTTYKGPNRIKMYLQDKGVKDQWIQRALKIYTYDQQLETARTVVNKNDRVDRDSIQMRKKKHTDRLTRQGFTFDVIQEALAQFDWDRSDETVALEKIAEKQLRKLQRKYEGRELEQRFTQQLMQRGFQYQEIQAYLNKQTDMEE